MTAVAALGIVVLALALLGAGAWAWAAWRKNRRLDDLAEQLYVDSRLEQLTARTLSAMREAVLYREQR